MLRINYITGDACYPDGPGVKIIAHICNDLGYWGKGFVLAISKRWPEAESAYRSWAKKGVPGFGLGGVTFVPVEENIVIANIIGQHGIGRDYHGVPPIRYEALESGLRMVAMKARAEKASVHMPRIGTGLAGGEWIQIEPIIIRTLIQEGVSVTVYDFNNES
jgi:O-acetyl-ADP-ribose deacetylase (regulator of RNase III)